MVQFYSADSVTNTAAWSFETTRFIVAFFAESEDMDPADSFDFQDDIDAVRGGAVEWFCASVRVFLKQPDKGVSEVAADYLGGCAYESVEEFYTAHRDANPMNRNSAIMRASRGGSVSICHYFPDMVREAIREARKALADVPKLRTA